MSFKVENIFSIPELKPLFQFLKDKSDESKFKSIQINKNGKNILVNLCLFDDESCEIRLSDVTQIEQMRKMKQQLTSNIAHELRTPTTCLRGFLETLHENSNISEEKRKYFIGKAYNQSKRLTNLIRDISLLSNLSEDPDQYNFEMVNIREIIDNIKIEFQEQLKKQNIKFESLDKDIKVEGSYVLLHSLFSNLIDNSIKYAGENSEIHIEHLQTKSGSIYLSYYDMGMGIDDTHLNRIFERFYRTNKGRSRNNGEGSGLGLSIVYNIIKLHKGDIQAKAHRSGGLEYNIRL